MDQFQYLTRNIRYFFLLSCKGGKERGERGEYCLNKLLVWFDSVLKKNHLVLSLYSQGGRLGGEGREYGGGG